MQHPDEGTIHAWLDDALPQEEASALEAHVAECTECQARVAEARGLIAASSRIIGALDIVPGGVIPKPARRRPWYTGPQFRAAAAVLVVAAATLVVMRSRDKATVERAMPVLASAPQVQNNEGTGQSSAVDAMKQQSTSVPAASTRALAGSSGNAASKNKAPLAKRTEAPQSTIPTAPLPAPRVAAAAEAKAPERDLSKPAEASARTAAKPLSSGSLLSEVVVTGVATTTDYEPLKVVRADTTALAVTTVFHVSDSVDVTLVEPRTNSFAATADRVERKVTAQSAAAPPPAADATGTPRLNSITWVDKLGRTVTLKGLLSKEQLEEIKMRLPGEKRAGIRR